jgi:hypothetical protein
MFTFSPPTTQASPQSTLPASTIFESWLPMDSEVRKNSNCNAKRQKLDTRGTVRLSLFDPKGRLRGALLDDGTVLRVDPKEAARFADLLEPAAAIEARGERASYRGVRDRCRRQQAQIREDTEARQARQT